MGETEEFLVSSPETIVKSFVHQGQEFSLIRVQGRRLSWFVAEGTAAAWMAVTTMPDPYPEENHGQALKGRLAEDGMRGFDFAELYEVHWEIKLRCEARRVHAECLRQEELEARATAELAELQERFEALREKGYYTSPAKSALDSCTEYGGYNQPRRVVPTALPGARKKIEQLERDPLRVLLEAIPGWPVHQDNLKVLGQVQILSHRSGGKIEAVPEEYLIECYEQIVDGRASVNWRELSDELRFELGYFVSPSDLTGVVLAPEIVQIGDEQCSVKWGIDDKPGMVVTVVRMSLATYQTHKDSLREIFPSGKLRLQVSLPGGDVVEGEPGDEITRHLAKAKKSKRSKRGK